MGYLVKIIFSDDHVSYAMGQAECIGTLAGAHTFESLEAAEARAERLSAATYGGLKLKDVEVIKN